MSRIMAIDYGRKRIGIAVSDPLGITARPLEVLERKALKSDLDRIAFLVKEFEVSLIVIGLPLNMNGTPGILTEEVKGFAAHLTERTGLAVEFLDERLTTWQAERMLIEEADVPREKRKKLRDKVAASLILQAYLERHGH
ncbi:MAG: Holliday junction resolvase RuvX [Endomicrobiales bacterium]